MVSARNIFKGLAAFAAVVLLALAGQGAAFADDARIRASQLEFRQDGKVTVMSVLFSKDPGAHWFALPSPHRLVIDLPATAFAFEKAALAGGGMVEGVRIGDPHAGASRIILSADSPFVVEQADSKPAADGFLFTLKLKSASAQDFAAMRKDHAQTTSAIPQAQPAGEAEAERFRIVIDPGHGGMDGGAEGANGTIEKDVTLAFGLALRDALAKDARFDVQMTRDNDRFVRLDDRVTFARHHKAGLLISIHADSIRAKGLRGATVYTGSDRATDAESSALADRENLSDQIAGQAVTDAPPEVSDILNELVRRETHGFSNHLAKLMVGQLRSTVGVIKNPHREAHFRVLKAPEVPSVLIELGYLSNPQDENSLSDPQWRAKAAAGLVKAVEEFASSRHMAFGADGR